MDGSFGRGIGEGIIVLLWLALFGGAALVILLGGAGWWLWHHVSIAIH